MSLFKYLKNRTIFFLALVEVPHGIDDRGMASHREVQMLRSNMNMYNEWAVDYAASRNLIVAENDHAVLFAGFGHRYPTL